PAPGQLVDVAAHRHVRHAQPVHQLRHPHPAVAPDGVEDELLALAGEHQPSSERITAAARAPTRTSPSARSPLSRSVPVAGTVAGTSPRLSTNRYRPRRTTSSPGCGASSRETPASRVSRSARAAVASSSSQVARYQATPSPTARRVIAGVPGSGPSV